MIIPLSGIVLALAIFLAGQTLDRAAAWANIIALFVAIASLAVAVVALYGRPRGRGSTSSGGGVGTPGMRIKQSGRARGDVINVAGNGNQITTNRRR